MQKKWAVNLLLLLLLLQMMISGCGLLGSEDKAPKEAEVSSKQPITRYSGEKSKDVSYVYTTKRELSLTFNGMGEDETMLELLDELDKYQIKATFFLPGMRVAEEPDIAKEIVSRGHEIANNTLNGRDMLQLSYEDIYKEIQLSNEIIKKETGVTPKFMRTRSGNYNDDVRLAAAQCGINAVVSYSLNLQAWHSENVDEVNLYVKRHVVRGGVIALNTQGNSQAVRTIPLIAQAAADVKYKLVTLSKLMEDGKERKPLESIDGYDAARMNENFEHTEYDLIKKADTTNKVIALTFDDWGSDFTITPILDILEKYNIKATFFLRANGVEKNPNLAKAIAEAGHDIANHTYTHPVITKLNPQQIQEQVVKAHQIITEAIQEKPTMLFRPPTGALDEKTARIVAATGYHTIAMYDVTTFDWDTRNKAKDIVRIINRDTVSGSIILLHMLDGLGTIEALPVVIETLHHKGYTFITMTDMLKYKHISQ